MPYSTKYSEERHSLPEAYVARANELREGKVLHFPLSSPEEAEKLVWLLHDYLHLIGCSSLYVVKQVGASLLIGKTKVKITTENVVSMGDRSFSKEFSMIIENLLSSTSPREYLSVLVRDESVSFGTLSAVTAEYSRVMES